MSLPEFPDHDELVDRARFAALVGIHQATITTWVQAEIVKPKTIRRGQYTAQGFSRQDVTFGRGLIALQRQRRGEFKLADLARIVRGEREQPELPHDPKA